jgi:anti-sigma B factor antagonist
VSAVKDKEVRAEARGDITVFHVDGRLVLGEGDAALTSAVKALLKDQGAPKTIIDLSKTTYVDSAGIGALVTAYTSVTSAGGALALAGASPRIIDLLKITRLDSVFPIFDSVDAAIAGLHSADRAGA